MRVAAPACLVLLAACSAGAGSQGERAAAGPAPRHDPSVITADELRTTSSAGLYDAVRALRPAWFRAAPTTLRPRAESGIIVYVDRIRLGGPFELNQIRPGDVGLIRYYSPSEAQAQFGPGHLHGAIEVITVRGR